MDFNLLHYYFDHLLVHYPHLNKKLYVYSSFLKLCSFSERIKGD